MALPKVQRKLLKEVVKTFKLVAAEHYFVAEMKKDLAELKENLSIAKTKDEVHLMRKAFQDFKYVARAEKRLNRNEQETEDLLKQVKETMVIPSGATLQEVEQLSQWLHTASAHLITDYSFYESNLKKRLEELKAFLGSIRTPTLDNSQKLTVTKALVEIESIIDNSEKWINALSASLAKARRLFSKDAGITLTEIEVVLAPLAPEKKIEYIGNFLRKESLPEKARRQLITLYTSIVKSLVKHIPDWQYESLFDTAVKTLTDIKAGQEANELCEWRGDAFVQQHKYEVAAKHYLKGGLKEKAQKALMAHAEKMSEAFLDEHFELNYYHMDRQLGDKYKELTEAYKNAGIGPEEITKTLQKLFCKKGEYFFRLGEKENLKDIPPNQRFNYQYAVGCYKLGGERGKAAYIAASRVGLTDLAYDILTSGRYSQNYYVDENTRAALAHIYEREGIRPGEYGQVAYLYYHPNDNPKGDPERAAKVLLQAPKEEAKTYNHYTTAGDYLVTAKSFDEAIVAYKKSGSPHGYFTVGNLLAGQNKIPEAMAAYKKAGEISRQENYDPRRYYEQAGNLLLQLRKYSEAAEMFELAEMVAQAKAALKMLGLSGRLRALRVKKPKR